MTKWSGDSFIVAFSSVDEAVQAALAIQRELTHSTSASASSNLQFRVSIHWGEVERLYTQNREELYGATVQTGLQALAQVMDGKIVLTQEAREALHTTEGFQLEPVPQADYQPTRLGPNLPLVYVNAPLPLWIQVAFKAAEEIEAAGIELPADLAERHDDYARGTCQDETSVC